MSKSNYITKFHYVYRITDLVNNKHYYGSRSCTRLPCEDLGIQYFSSSHDKQFILDQKNNSDNYRYKIIWICNTRKAALALEIKLHNKLDVGRNNAFYNLAKQTSTRFSTAGQTTPDEIRRKIGDAGRGRKCTDETRRKMSNSLKGNTNGKNPSIETRRKMSEANIGTFWINNGILSIKIPPDSEIPFGFVKGRMSPSDEARLAMSKAGRGKSTPIEVKRKMSAAAIGKICINNGIENRRILPDDPMPDGFSKGILSKGTTNKIWINNGIVGTTIDPDEDIPLGFSRGRLPFSNETCLKIAKSKMDKIYINDGKNMKILSPNEDIPLGFSRGRLPISEETKRKISETKINKNIRQQWTRKTPDFS